jgi:hypothetical protein
MEWDRLGYDQLVVAVFVGERRSSKWVGSQHLGVCVGDPAGRFSQSFAIDVSAERAQQIFCRALHGAVVDASGGRIVLGLRDERKPGNPVIAGGHTRLSVASR